MSKRNQPDEMVEAVAGAESVEVVEPTTPSKRRKPRTKRRSSYKGNGGTHNGGSRR